MTVHPLRLPTRLAGLTALAFLLLGSARAAEVRLARHPDYHGGKIVFSYRGDLWLVKEDGSQPRRLTAHRSPSVHPRFSPDGKWIAFSSARYGNHDVFVLPSEGGEARRLTYNSAGDTVVGWTRDAKRVVFNSARGLLYPGIPSLYTVPLDGGIEEPLPTGWGYWGSFSPDGQKLAYNRHPMVWSRKHYRGSYAADLWVMNVTDRTSRKLLDGDLPDAEKPNNFWPMYGNGAIYFVSDRDVRAKAGSPRVMDSKNNIWKISEEGGPPEQVTRHTSGSLFWPSMSADGKTIVYEENFGLWKLDTATGQTQEIKIDITPDEKENNLETLTVSGEADSYSLSPSGKRAVIATHGELFTIATDRGEVRRLSRTADVREAQPVWSPDGKRIAFVSDRSGREEIWTCDEMGGNLKRLTNSDTQKGQPVFSPDSQELLYTASDRALHKYSFSSGTDTVLTRGEVVGFGGSAVSGVQWSPDGKWVAYTKSGRDLLPHVFVLPAAGGAEKRITDAESYSDSSALWTPDGKALVYLSGTDVGNIGQGGRSSAQIFVVTLARQDKEPGERGIDSEAEASADRPRTGMRQRPEGAAGKVDVSIDFDRISRRARRVTRSGDSVSAMAVAPDGKSLAFVTSGVEGGRSVTSIWSVSLEGDATPRRLSQSSAPDAGDGAPAFRGRFGGLGSLQFAKDGRTLFYRQGTGIYALTVGGAGGRGGAEGAASAAPSFPSRRGGGAAAAAGDASAGGAPAQLHDAR